jgi:predicted acylesterase/phospholipase RssA
MNGTRRGDDLNGPGRCAALLAALLMAAPLGAQAPDTLRRTAGEALVLSGGGSRGLAHAGAIQGLEERGHDPELVVGTSVGALVGALYAAGYTPDEIQRRIRGINWSDIFTPQIVLVGPEREPRYPLLTSDLQVDPLRFNRGFVPQWRINRALVQLLFDAEARSRGDFDRLARRYRAVATDLRTGRPVVLARGDLARAARASMAVPGVFSPVEWDGVSLVDGGIAANLPTGPARALTRGRLIAVDVGLPGEEIEGRSATQVAGRALDLLEENAQRDQPRPDVLVVPDIPPAFWGITFPGDPGGLFALGLDAARREIPQGSATPRRRALPPPPRAFGALRVEAPDSATARLARRVFARVMERPYDPQEVLWGVDRLYTTGLFEGIWPRVEGGGAEPTLVLRLEAPPRLSAGGAVGFDTDRGGRVWVEGQRSGALGGAPALFTATGSLDAVRQFAAVSARVFPTRLSPLAWSTGGYVSGTVARDFAGPDDDIGVTRFGAWTGVELQQLLVQRVASAVLRGERVVVEDGGSGWTAGPAVRVSSSRADYPVAGVPFDAMAEARWGDFEYRRVMVQGSVRFERGPLRLAGVYDAAAASRQTPPDALSALGDDHFVPGFRWGEGRARSRALLGADAAYRLPLGPYLRGRVRGGTVGDGLGELGDKDGWVLGADAGLVTSTPFGAVSLTAGAERRGNLRVILDVGPRF